MNLTQFVTNDKSLGGSITYIDWTQVVKLVKNGDWVNNQELRNRLIPDGKQLSFHDEKNDVLFILFYIYENKKRKNNLSDHSVKAYYTDLKFFMDYLNHLSPPVPLSKIGYVELDQFEKIMQQKIEKNELASSTANRRMTILRSLLRYGARVKYFSEDLSHNIRVPEINRVRQERRLTRKEVNLILKELRKKPLNRLVGSFLMAMGLWISELCEANWGDVYNSIHGQPMIKIHGKGNKDRNLKIRSEVYSLLLEYRASNNLSIIKGRNPEEPLIVNSKGTRINDRVVRYMIDRAARRAGVLKDVSPHWFRHSCLTFALDDGANIVEVKQLAGHSDIRTTQKYLHDLEAEKNKSASDYIQGIVF